mmetsp:Transcript_12369/g.35371  ORF Transcript_12369/g.35371 Transcript_12369/m.35371 type:complete len:228 (+) Transcript_12369:373-1056(+)
MGLVKVNDCLVQDQLFLPATLGLALPKDGQRYDQRGRCHEGLVDVGGPNLAKVVVDGGNDGAVFVRGEDVAQVGLGGILLELDVEAHPDGAMGDGDAGTALGLVVPSCSIGAAGRIATDLGHAGKGRCRGHAGRLLELDGANNFGLLLFGSRRSVVEHIYLGCTAEQINGGGHILLKTGHRGGRLVMLFCRRWCSSGAVAAKTQEVDLTTYIRRGRGGGSRRRTKAQ